MPRCIMAANNTGTQSTPEKLSRSSGNMLSQVVRSIPSAPSIGGGESGSTFMDISSYRRVCYGSNHVTSKCRYLTEDTELAWATNKATR